jgi:hypothetical protein
MTPDPHIAVIGPLALAVLDGSYPPEVLRDAVAEAGYVLPGVHLDEALYQPRRHGRGMTCQTAMRIQWVLEALYGPHDADLHSSEIAASAIVRH